MDFEQVVITLTPVYSPDTPAFRSLTFSSNDDTIPIGRASKSEAKNLVPEHDNGWFNSRVMSRSHAVLSVCMDKQTVYVRDHGSLHGTQLNDNKIKPKENVAVKSGDVLTFGSEISRGTETFRPIAVRLDCQWHVSKPVTAGSKETPKPTTNTFSVPEDEDEVIEVVDSREAHEQSKTPQNVSDSSDADYGSDMSRPLDLTSPLTSPDVKTSELAKSSPTDSKQVNDHPQEHSALEGRDTNVLSPGSLNNEDNEDGSQSGSEDDDDANSESQDSVVGQAKEPYEEEDSESDNSEDDRSESNELDEQSSAAGMFGYKPFRVPVFPTSKRDDTPEPGTLDFLLPGSNTSAPQPDETAGIRRPTSNAPATGSANYTVPWQEYLIPRVPSPSDKAMAKPMGTPASSYPPYTDFSSNFEMWANSQGPSHSSYPDPVNMANPYGSITANETFPFGPHRSSGYLRHMAGEFLGEEQAPSVSDEKSFELTGLRSNKENSKDVETSAEPSNTRFSIADIVEKSFSQTAVPNQLKRKADDFEIDLTGDSNEISGDSQDSITDAQPRPDMQNIEISQPHLLDAQEPRRKRIKTKQVYSFMKYATVAAIGAAVGSIGTIAGLASLPADFFN